MKNGLEEKRKGNEKYNLIIFFKKLRDEGLLSILLHLSKFNTTWHSVR